MRRLLRRAVLLALIPVAFVGLANAWVLLAARGDSAGSIGQVPRA